MGSEHSQQAVLELYRGKKELDRQEMLRALRAERTREAAPERTLTEALPEAEPLR
jgi:hypothetical protein